MNKMKKIVKIINSNKPFLAVLSVVLSLLLVAGSTYSWITYSDERINQNKPNQKKLSAVIDEIYTPNLQWEPGTTTDKKMAIRNDGQMPAVIRVSLYEFFAQFELDTIDGVGNGNLKIVSKPSNTTMTMADASTWKKGSTYKFASGKYYTAAEVYKSDKNNPKTAYIYNGSRVVEGLKYITINFNDKDIYDVNNQPALGTKDYWYYSEGYFYYSEPLQPKEKTKELVQSVTIDKNLPNKHKGSFYQLIPVMNAHDRTKALMENWNITSGSYVDLMYRNIVR